MHKFAVIHKPSDVVCYSANNVKHCVAPNNNYEIVSLDSSNATKFTTVNCDLSFNDYSEIVAALSGEFIGFHTDENDNLSISNESRTVVIPALLFTEACLDVSEVVFGDVCEMTNDDETVANKAIQLWVASRFLATNDTTDTTDTEMSTSEMSTSEMSTSEMSNVFKKTTTLPVVITFKHSVSKSHEYAGCPRIVAECAELGFKAAQTGYGYDMVAALMNDFINANCTQYAIQCVFAFNELRGGYNYIQALNGGKFYANAGCLDDVVYFLDDVGLSVTFNCKKSGEITSVVIYK